MTDTITPIHALRRIARGDEARALATDAYRDLFDDLAELSAQDWDRPTVCDPWTVTDVVRHLLGAAKAHAGRRELVRQTVWASRHKKEYAGNDMDAMNALQVADHAGLGPQRLLDDLRRVAPAAVDGRMRIPWPLRRLSMPLPATGSTGAGSPSRWQLGELMDVILTRDVWMHRLDIARAVDRDVRPGRADAQLIKDLVAEWAGRHGQPFQLELTGRAGGRFATDGAGPTLVIDAHVFAETLAGRREPDDAVPGHALMRTRVLF